MNKKVLANVLAASLVLTMTPVVPNVNADAAQKLNTSSAEGSTGILTGKDAGSLKGAGLETELDCTGWWTAHTSGVQVDEKGITITFKNITYASSTGNYNTPSYVVYTGDEAKVNGNGYAEYYVMRSDSYGWNGAAKVGDGLYTSKNAPTNADEWAKWLEKNKSAEGVDYQVSAVLKESNLLMEIEAAGITEYVAVPVDTTRPVYLSLTGDGCTLKSIEQKMSFDDFTGDIPASLFVETLTGKVSGDDIWAEKEIAKGRTYTLTGDGALDLYVGYTGKEKDTVDKSLFAVELRYVDDREYGITTESRGDAWFFGGYNDVVTGPAIAGNTAPDSKSIEEGHQYKVSVARTDDDVTITYLDLDTGDTHMEIVVEDTKFTCPIEVQVIAQIGTFQVCQDKLTMPEFKIGNCYTSSAWWSNTGDTYDQTLTGDGEVSWYVGYYENIQNVAGAFSAELVAEENSLKYFITTGSNIDAWYASEPSGTTHTTGDPITGVALNSKSIELGHKYKVTVKREDQKFTITYFDLDTNSVYTEFVAANTTFPKGDVKVHIKAQVGKFKIEETPFDVMPEVKDNNTPMASYDVNASTSTSSGSGSGSSSTPAPDDKEDGETLDCGGWWTTHSRGFEIGAEGMALSFNSKSYASATNVYETPVLVVYSSEDGAVKTAGTAGYTEYAVIRSDSYAWCGDMNTGDGLAAWEAAGYAFKPGTVPETFVADNKAGVKCLVQAIKVGDKVYVQFTNGTVTTVTTISVASDAKVLLALTGEQCKLTGIKATSYTGIDGVTPAPSESASPSPSVSPSPEPGATTDPNGTPGPDNSGDNNTPGNNNTSGGDTPQTPNETNKPDDNEKETKKKMKVSGIKAKKNTKKITGTVSVKGAKVKVKVGKKAYKNAKVNGKKFTFTASSKLKKGTKITIKITKSGYKTITKTVKVK